MNIPGQERFLKPNEIIVSKTDIKGLITYVNSLFCEIADFSYSDVIGKPHNIVRHPLMPSCVFKLLWETLKEEKEIFAYVLNSNKRGNAYYWVLAHVTPSRDDKESIIGYHSNRRPPAPAAIQSIKTLYATLLAEENKQSSRRVATEAGYDLLMKILNEKGFSYEEFIFSL